MKKGKYEMETLKLLLKKKLKEFLEEDIGYGDLTTNLLIPPDLIITAKVITNENCIVAGIEEACILAEIAGVKSFPIILDGKYAEKGSIIIKFEGKARSILSIERTILNILMKMSGIATITNNLVNRINKINPKIRLACTRKTTPGFRYFEKKAVLIGGGDTHRFRLDDMILIKDNHLACIKDLNKAIKELKSKLSFSKKIEIEVKSIEDAIKVASLGIDIIMLDNFTPDMAKKVINELENRGLRQKILLEISGNITPNNIEEYAQLNIDIISMGFITHSVKAVNMSLDIP